MIIINLPVADLARAIRTLLCLPGAASEEPLPSVGCADISPSGGRSGYGFFGQAPENVSLDETVVVWGFIKNTVDLPLRGDVPAGKERGAAYPTIFGAAMSQTRRPARYRRAAHEPSSEQQKAGVLPLRPLILSHREAAIYAASAASASARALSAAPLASTSRSTNSMTAMAALSPWRKPAFMMRR